MIAFGTEFPKVPLRILGLFLDPKPVFALVSTLVFTRVFTSPNAGFWYGFHSSFA